MRILSKMVVVAGVSALLMGAAAGTFAQSNGEPGRESGKSNPLKNAYFGE